MSLSDDDIESFEESLDEMKADSVVMVADSVGAQDVGSASSDKKGAKPSMQEPGAPSLAKSDVMAASRADGR